MINLAYLVSEPIIYQVGMLRQLAAHPDINLTVFFRSQRPLKHHKLEGFEVEGQWDTNLLEGYPYEFLPVIGSDMKFSLWRPLNYGMAPALKSQQFDVLWVHGYNYLYHLYVLRRAKKFGIKTLVRGESTLKSCVQTPLRSLIRRPFFQQLDRYVDGYLTIGHHNQAFYKYYGVPEQKLFSAPYTVDNHHFQNYQWEQVQKLRQSLHLDPARPIILFASKMHARKRAVDLFEAYRRVIDLRPQYTPYLLFVGDGPDRKMIEQQAKALGLSGVRFLGFQNQSQMPLYYALADIFVLPSEREPWGLVVNEAMNGGCAIITTTEVGAAGDLVDEQNGHVYEPGDVERLTHALWALSQNRDLCEQKQHNSLDRINQWGVDRTVSGIHDACHRLLRAPDNRP